MFCRSVRLLFCRRFQILLCSDTCGRKDLQLPWTAFLILIKGQKTDSWVLPFLSIMFLTQIYRLLCTETISQYNENYTCSF